jgi:hypothetical protein
MAHVLIINPETLQTVNQQEIYMENIVYEINDNVS